MTYKLCFIKDNIAYFTKKSLKDQWGDDWDSDACFAGKPYCDKPGQIAVLMFLDAAAGVTLDTSVESLNRKDEPWMVSGTLSVWAGATRKQFIDFIRASGGTVFAPVYEKKGKK